MAFTARFNNPNEGNTFANRGIRSLATALAYAATIAFPAPTRKALRHYADFALLTGALTLNFTDVTMYEEGDEMFLSFVADGTGRTVTWGTNIRAAANLAMTANQVGLAHLVFINSKWTVVAQAATAA
jgi:hypothetical protein